MKRPVPTATRASHVIRQVATRPARLSKIDNIGRNNRARRAAVADGTQAAMTIGRSIGQRPIFALLATAAIGLMMGLLRPRH